MSEFLARKITTVITVCGDADRACPVFPGQVQGHHWGSMILPRYGTEAEILAAFRRLRDKIRKVFDAYAAGLNKGRSIARAVASVLMSHAVVSPAIESCRS